MRNNLRSLLSVPAIAIAAMAVSATTVNAQCPGGCFGYPTPNQPVFRSYTPTVQYQSVQVAPAQTFVQPQVFAAPAFIPAQTFFQPQTFIAPEQFAPVAPIEQTFVFQPTIVAPAPTATLHQYSPQQTYPGLPAGAYNVHPSFPIQSGLPMEQSLPMADEAGTITPPATAPMEGTPATKMLENNSPAGELPADSMEESSSDNVQEGQIEGEIISPADAASKSSVLEEEDTVDVPLTAAGSATEEAAKQAANEKAEIEKAAERKAALERAAKRKAAKEKAAKKDTAEQLTKEERIAKLETSLKRQIKRAEQLNMRDLGKKLDELNADEASAEKIKAAKEEAAKALKEKLAEIEKRVQARINQLKK